MSLKKILDQLVGEIVGYFEDKHGVDQAEADILALLPEEKKEKKDYTTVALYWEIRGFNECLKDIKEKFNGRKGNDG